ncbi:hypothetical protein CYD30_09135 [Kosakonia cowanii]|nr:hypothetical protein CYD30_09135 [Kosakonia cowanii]
MPDGAALIGPTESVHGCGCRPDKAKAAIRQRCPMALRLSGLRKECMGSVVGRIRRQPPSGSDARWRCAYRAYGKSAWVRL